MVYVIVGPTASGKSKIASIISAKYNAPIINADAFQIYKDMDIGTAKISKYDPDRSKYYLLDIITPDQTYSVKQYQDDFRKVFNSLDPLNNDIVIVGGTGLYIRAALYDYEFPEEIEQESFDDLTDEELYNLLKEKDPASLEKIHKNNRKRLVRALNIALHSDKKKSENIASQKHDFYIEGLQVKFIFINPKRDELYERIDNRVDQMFRDGFVNEVKALTKKYQLSETASQAIGYKEVMCFLNREYDILECKNIMKKRTRNYAKRQVTFFTHQFPTIMYEDINKLKEDIQNGLL
ncbi:MAG: tRNA (adenosine(37)-N6)-dimethylallyltransferase MiaA [Coprobacillus sp.]|nr:tRNA (adenosine(37)-N6)-dimethylallyltransferase MiaA [Coprobacillus sp.]